MQHLIVGRVVALPDEIVDGEMVENESRGQMTSSLPTGAESNTHHGSDSCSQFSTPTKSANHPSGWAVLSMALMRVAGVFLRCIDLPLGINVRCSVSSVTER